MSAAEVAAADTELKRHLDDLQDHIQALKEQTASMVGLPGRRAGG